MEKGNGIGELGQDRRSMSVIGMLRQLNNAPGSEAGYYRLPYDL
jgi:hypothetical protein